MRFSELKIGDLFYYNGFVYRKHSSTQGFNVRLGLFVLYPDEEVDFIEFDNTDVSGFKSNALDILILLIPFFMLLIYLLLWVFI